MRRQQILRRLDALELTDEQRTKVREFMERSRAESEPLLKELADIRAKTRESVRGVLTPEQLAKLPNRTPRGRD